MASLLPKEWITKEPKLLAKKSAELAKQTPAKNRKDDDTSPAPLHHVNRSPADLSVPDALIKGTTMTKVSGGNLKKKVFQLDPDEGRIIYMKSGKIGIVPIETIKEIRSGSNARYDRLQFKLPEDTEARWITVIYILEGTYKTLHLIAETRDVLAMWDTALRKLVAVRHGLMFGLGNVEVRQAVWERQYWKGADREGDQKLDFGEVEALCRRLNANLGVKELWKLFNVADTKSQGHLDFEAFQIFVKLLKKRPEVEVIYKKLCNSNGGRLDFATFEKFMHDTQKSTLSKEQLEVIFVRHASLSPASSSASAHTSPPTPQQTATELTLEAFSDFLLSPDNTPFSELTTEIWQDMTQPISSYYISSSHNTYLVGHQLVGVSTVEGYIRALLHSCRSVELDIYDGDSTVGPVVFHGKTLTSSVPLRDICVAIAKYAFVASPFPVLISAEVHCSVEQQDVMVDIMHDVFGDILVRAPLEGSGRIERLPSPEALKGKVLLKAKNLYVVAELEALRNQKHLTVQSQKSNLEAKRPSPNSPSSSSASDESDASSGQLGKLKAKWRHVRRRSQTPSSPKMSVKLAALIVYTVGVKCHGLRADSGVKYAPEHIFSLSESRAFKILKGDGATGGMRDLIKHNQEHLVRIYPTGLRVDSTNYTPHRLWAAGAQVVAINWQTFDLGYTMNQAMFQRNGRSGHLLKPAALREGGEELLSKHTNHVLDITIISAQQLPRPKNSRGEEKMDKSVVDPFVQVSIHIPDWTHAPLLQSSDDAPPTLTPAAVEARTVSASSKVVNDNGFNPVWQEKLSLPFDCVGDMRELVFVHFAVRHDGDAEDDEPLAMYCTPLSCLESGYRHLPLHDAQLTQHLFSTLFVKIGVRNE